MKNLLKPSLIFSLLFCTLLVRVAEAQWVVYTADVLPDTFTEKPFLISSSAGNPVNEIIDDPAIGGNKLLLMSTDNNFYWRQNILATPSPEAATIVVRAKGLGEGKDMVFEIDLDFGASGTAARQRVIILSNGNWRGDGASFGSGSTGVDVLDWNIYRFTKEGNEVALYINENPEPVFVKATTTGNVGNNHFRIGDGWNSGTNVMGAHIDWIVWDVTGAYSPNQSALPGGLTGVEEPPASTEAEIIAFRLPGQVGGETISSENGTVDITVPQGTNLVLVVPATVTVSANATIDPPADVAQDFSNDVAYTVTAQDGTTTKGWTVRVTEAASSEKEITSFKLTGSQIGDAVINSANGTVTVSVPLGENISNVVPVVFTISDQATVDPLVTSAQNFTSPVVYTVTAQDNSTKQWTVTANTVDPGETFVDYQAEDALFAGKVDNQHAGYTGSGFIDFLSTGDNYIIFTVCQQQAGSRTAKFRYSLGKDEVRTGSLYVNDEFISLVEFPPTATFTEWAEASAVVALPAGISNVKLTWDETDGPNLDKLSLGGEQCASYTLTVSTTNSGVVAASPERANNKYFDGETVTLLAENKPDLVFANWSGGLTGNDNPAQVVIDSDKNITAHFNVVNTYTLNVSVNGIGEVQLDPSGGVYAEGTVVTLTANSVLGSTFQGWSGSLSGGTSPETITMDANKSVTATFTSNISVDFETPVGFASVVTGSGTYQYTTETFFGPTTGGQHAEDTVWIDGPGEFDRLAKYLYDRNRAYRNASQSWGSNAKKAPLVMVLKEGVYTEGTSASSAWGNHMMTIQEQGDLTIIGQGNVVLKFGFNIKRSWNILIRNITFQDYHDDGINIGETETHHIWIDHCTIGHPTTMPTDTEHPDGGIDVKAGASYVTISWCNYRNSWKTGLVGHSDSNEAEDLGRLKVTYYGNYFYNTNSRNPRVRFGEVHVLNNLEEKVMLYGIAASNKSQVYAENNFFLNSRWPMYADRATADFRAVYGNNSDNVFTSKTGNREATGLKAVGNEYDDSGIPVITAQINPAMLNPGGRSIKFDEHNAENVFNPSTYYSYTAFPASVVRTIVPLFAGAQKVDFFQASSEEEGTISVTGTLEPFTQTFGSPSEAQTYTVSATDITGSLTITPPANFEVSVNETDWFTNSNPLAIASVDGAVASATVHIRLNAGQTGNYSGNIVHVASGAAAVLAGVSGETKNLPGSIPEGTWTIYEANELPNEFSSPFVTSQQSGSFSNAIIADPDKEENNLLHMQTNGNSDNNQWRQNVTSGLQDITVVFRAKGNDSGKNLVFDADLDFGGFRWQMRILSDGNYSVANGTTLTGDGSLGVNTLEWNTYRFTRKGNEAALYMNENPTPVFTGTAATNNQSYFRFGDGWGSGTIDSNIDWVVWDVTGAYSPSETSLPAHLTGGGTTPVPTISAIGTLQSFEQIIGSPSAVQTYTVSGSNLEDNITITPPLHYEVSVNGTTWFTNATPLVLVHADGAIEATSVSVRLNASVAGDYSGAIVHTSAEANAVNMIVNGSVVAEPTDTELIVTGNLDPFSQEVGQPSETQSYTVSGSNLTDNITITPPANFEVSSDNGATWKTNVDALILTPTDGAVASTTILVRLNASEAGQFTGNIAHLSEGASAVNVAVTGETTIVTSIGESVNLTFSFWPNPASDHLTIQRDDWSVDGTINLYTPIGVRVLTQTVERGADRAVVELSGLPQGLFFIEYTTPRGTRTLRLAIQ